MATREWSSLPEDIWQLVLYHVSLSDRLGSCSRVCVKLCRAAAAATQHLELDLEFVLFSEREQRSKGFKSWLTQHGQHVTSLQLFQVDSELAELPCQHLRQLELIWCHVQLGASSSQPGILSALPALKQLQIQYCWVTDGSDGLAAFISVTVLQHLELADLKGRPGERLKLPTDVLQQLTQLTSLHLDSSVHPTAASMGHIRSLQHLKELWLNMRDLVLSPSSTPGLMQLTALTKLGLSCAQLDLAVLCGVTQLQHLELRFATILGALDTAPLLSFIGQQQLLQLLTLEDHQHSPAAPAAYTALTASSKLQQLEVFMCMSKEPAGLWQPVFRPAQQLPDLWSFSTTPYLHGGAHASRATPFSTADAEALASCCPGLRSITIAAQPDAQLSALSKLTALTYLSVSLCTAASVESVAAITQLQRLSIRVSPPVVKTALLPLTSLQRLTVLEVEDTVDDGEVGVVFLYSKSPDDDRPNHGEPDVWRQLLEDCQ